MIGYVPFTRSHSRWACAKVRRLDLPGQMSILRWARFALTSNCRGSTDSFCSLKPKRGGVVERLPYLGSPFVSCEIIGAGKRSRAVSEERAGTGEISSLRDETENRLMELLCHTNSIDY